LERISTSDDFFDRNSFDRGDVHHALVNLGEIFERRDFALPLKHPSIAARMLLKDLDRAAVARADFSLKSTHGVEYKFSALKGKVVLIDFWATWCPPCRDSLPALEKVHRDFAEKGVVVLGIDDEPPSIVDAYLSKNGITYPTLVDPDRKVHNMFGVDGDAVGIPTTVIFDREGNYSGHIPLPHTEEKLRAALKAAGIE
jgi:cytochrome c biogenesis protein CcmG, thiol:disulfide interchange protein DsbE